MIVTSSSVSASWLRHSAEEVSPQNMSIYCRAFQWMISTATWNTNYPNPWKKKTWCRPDVRRSISRNVHNHEPNEDWCLCTKDQVAIFRASVVTMGIKRSVEQRNLLYRKQRGKHGIKASSRKYWIRQTFLESMDTILSRISYLLKRKLKARCVVRLSFLFTHPVICS